MNKKLNLTKKLDETLTREIIAENKAKKALKEQEETTLSPETEKMVQDAVDALKQSNGGKIDENLIGDDTAQLIMNIVVGAYGAAVAAGVGNLIKIALTAPKEELKDAFKKIAADVHAKHGAGSGSKYGGGIGGTPQKESIIKEENETLDPEVQELVDKIKIEIEKKKGTGKIEKTEMNEGLEQLAEVVSLIMLGFYGVSAVSYFGSLLALAFKKGGKEEFQKAVKQLQAAHKGSDGVPRFNK